MRPKNIQKLLEEFLKFPDMPTIFLWGAPGVGKSDIIYELACKEKIEFLDWRLVTRDPTDIKGIPFPIEGHTVFLPPKELPKTGRGIFFLDELNLAPPLVQAAAYQLILNKRIEQYILPKGWMIVAAGNSVEHAAHVYKMAAPLCNRFIHINFDVHVGDWLEWAVRKGLYPDVVEFISFKPELLLQFNPRSNAQAFPTPRSWEYVAKIYKTELPVSSLEIADEIIRGAVGEAATSEFKTFQVLKNELPAINEILEGRSKIVPRETDRCFAVVSALCIRAEAIHVNTLLEYSELLPSEAAVLLGKLLMVKNKEALENAPHFSAWAQKYADLIL